MTDTPRSLTAPALRSLPLGTLKPAGWLRKQLRIQAEGLSGHLDEFWPDVADSKWFGGQAEGWERAPYWLDGFIPLAYLLDDDALIAKAKRRVEQILALQREDGWIGPDDVEKDVWPAFLVSKVLLQYAEASGDMRAEDAVAKLLRRVDKWIGVHGLGGWAQVRWQELSLVAQWLHDRTGDPWLVELSHRAARFGYDWVTHFNDLPYKGKSTRWDLDNHVVNHAMALKVAAVRYRMTGDEADRELARTAIEHLDSYHGQASGVFTGDESLAGLMPSQGTELCAVVDYMYSLEVLSAALGDVWLGDRLEKIAFNALPATLSPDIWSHQYDQQANQVICAINDDHLYTSNDGDANIFGLEPHYGCCTSNLHQGWPKFAASLCMQQMHDIGDDGLAMVAYAPCNLEHSVHGHTARISVETNYPFEDTVLIRVRTDEPVHLPIHLRIPEWCRRADVFLGVNKAHPEPGTFHRIDRTWEGEEVITLHLHMEPRVIERPFGYAIERGPLVYSLKVGEEWKRVHEDVPGRELPHGDWEVHPTTPWNYALAIDPKNPAGSIMFTERHVGDTPFSPDSAPVTAKVGARRVPSWQIEHNAAAPPPESPVASDEPIEEVTLIPYGCTNLRVTEFPILTEQSDD